MKTNTITMAVLSMYSAVVFSSCGDNWLDVTSKTESNSANYYKSQEDGLRALYACYDGWQRTVSDGPSFTIYQLTETMSDECFGGTGNTDGRNTQVLDRFDMNQAPSYTDMHNTLWASYYAAIFRCNEFIDKAGGIAWDDDRARATYLGETYAIRGLCYFDMVRTWEHIPLLLHASKDNIPQADPDSVYAQIVKDLTYAAETIPLNAYPKADAAKNDGHITRYAAMGMLARVYLFYDGYYNHNEGKPIPGGLTKEKALSYCEEIIKSGEYGLIPQFKNLWPAASDDKTGKYLDHWVDKSSYAGVGNKETVLSMKFNYTADYNGNNDGNRFVVNLGMRTGANVYDRYGQGWGALTVNPKQASVYGPGDTRRQASIIDCQQLRNYEKNYIADQREYTGYAIKKYTPLSKNMTAEDGTTSLVSYLQGDMAGDFMISQYQDWILLRYSDVLLMAAELGSSKAQQYLNEVRKRAYTQDDGSLNGNYVTVTPTRENIWKERQREFAFEGIRYWDQLRQGLRAAANQIAEHNIVLLSGGVRERISIEAENIIKKRGFCQIPLSQITLSNGVLKQNAGW